MAHQLYRRGSAASSAGLTGPSPPFQTSGTAMIMPPGEPDREQEDTPAVTISHHVPLQPSYQFWVSPPSEMEALSFFFQNVVRFSEKSEDSASGWLGELRGLHKETLPGSHLDNATVALSWINLGTATKRKDAIENARIAYGKALRNTREALNDPIQRRTDETLVAALVLGYFEFVISTFEGRDDCDYHGSVLPYLLKERGEEQLKEPRSRKLFFNVQNQIVNTCIHRTGSASNVLGDLSTVRDDPDNPGSRLSNLMKEINEVQVFIFAIVGGGGGNDDESRVSVASALEQAWAVDKQMVHWSTMLRAAWQVTVIEDGSSVCKVRDHYWKYVHIYNNLWICRLWNQFRTARIKLQTAILNLMTWAHHEHGTDFVKSQTQVQNYIHAMADDICATIPFCLGNQTPLDKEPIASFPDQENTQGRALGWFLCLVPLRALQNTPYIPERQKEWISRQLMRVCQVGSRFIGRGNPMSLLTSELPTFVFSVPMATMSDSEATAQMIDDGYSSLDSPEEEGNSPQSLSSLLDMRSSLSDRMSQETPQAQSPGLSFFNTTNPDQIKDKDTQRKIRREVMRNHVAKNHATKQKVSKAAGPATRTPRQKLLKSDKPKG